MSYPTLTPNDPAAGPANTAAMPYIVSDALRTGEPIALPRGVLTFADQITLNGLASSLRWIGHDGGTTITTTRNDVRTLVLWGGGILTANATFVGSLMKATTLYTPIGTYIRAWQVDTAGANNMLARVKAQTPNGYILDRNIPAHFTQVTTYAPGSLPVSRADEGSLYVTPPEGAFPLPLGTLVYITSGHSTANESTGEYRSIVATGDRIRLDRPLRRSYTDAIVVPMTPAGGVFEGITFAAPPNPQKESMFAKFAHDLVFRHCELDTSLIDPNVTTCGYVEFHDCKSYGRLMTNTSHDVRIFGGRWGGLDAEEACTDLEVSNAILLPLRHGIRVDPLANKAIRVRDTRIEGAGEVADAAGNRFSSLFLSSTDNDISRVSIVNTQPGSLAYCGGDRLSIIDTSMPEDLHITGGRDIYLSNLRAHYVEFNAASNGDAYGLLALHNDNPDWRIV